MLRWIDSIARIIGISDLSVRFNKLSYIYVQRQE